MTGSEGCWDQGCATPRSLVVLWRKDVYDGWLLGRDGYAANSTCDAHLIALLDLIRQDWDGKVQVMAPLFYEQLGWRGQEAFSGQGLAKAVRQVC